MLDTQISLYSVDTGNFYSSTEAYLHCMNCRYRQERNSATLMLSQYEELLFRYGYDSEDLKNLRAGDIEMCIRDSCISALLSRTSFSKSFFVFMDSSLASKRASRFLVSATFNASSMISLDFSSALPILL